MNDPEQVPVALGTRSYTVSIAPGLFGEHGAAETLLGRHIRGRKVLLVSDSHVAPLYAGPVLKSAADSGAEASLHVIPAGERHKTFSTVEGICRAAVKEGLDRKSYFLALGGGVVCDLTGFAASIYMRGVSFLSIPTSLLAMIDASVGGKTGADLPEGKNLIGTFWQPKAVLTDVSFLTSLPETELRCGCSELLKHAILFDPDFFRRLEESAEDFLAFRDPAAVSREIARSCRLKAAVVSGDERESGARALLNFGHTFGHAAEKLRNYEMSHGDAVAFGMAVASDLSVRLGMIREDEAARIESILRSYHLPTRVSGLDPADILQTMRSDKKNADGHIRLILPRRIGQAEIVSGVPDEELLAVIGEHCD